MNTKTTLAILAVLTAFALVAATATSVIVPADAQGGPRGEKNFGQCKQDFNEKPCKKFHTGSG
jgi:hypothetical protein